MYFQLASFALKFQANILTLRSQDEDWKNDWKKFSEQLSGIGLTIKDVAGDGNCMFRYVF